MKKIIEAAEQVCELRLQYNSDTLSRNLCDDIAEYKRLKETPITEEWLKRHGFVETGSKPGIFYTRWGHYNTIRFSFDDDSSDFYIEKSTGDMHFDMVHKHNATLADLYDACELCKIELE